MKVSEGSVDGPELLELLRIDVPRSRHDDLGGRGRSSKPLENRRQTATERCDGARPVLTDAHDVVLAFVEEQVKPVVAPERQRDRTDSPPVGTQEGERGV